VQYPVNLCCGSLPIFQYPIRREGEARGLHPVKRKQRIHQHYHEERERESRIQFKNYYFRFGYTPQSMLWKINAAFYATLINNQPLFFCKKIRRQV
jgi:hypothetical protein